MQWITRIAAMLLAMLVLGLPVVGGAAQASTSTNSSPGVVIQASCHYRVTGDGVAVRRAPDINADVIKRKDRGERVTGPCQDYYNGRWWTRVYLSGGGTGWMASAFLEYLGYW